MLYIYKLINPINNKVFYIGRTCNPKSRLKNHINFGKKLNIENNLSIYINNILLQNSIPTMEIICTTEGNGKKLEQGNIKEYSEKFKIYNRLFLSENAIQ